MERTPQTLANHGKFDPLFHFFLAPLSMLFILYAIRHLYRHQELQSLLLLVVAVAASLALFKFRIYSLKVQDRIIRLEERLRLGMLLPENLRGRVGELTNDQLIGLRFASDSELPALAKRALDEKLSKADIKKAIVNWRPDYFRV